MEIIFIITIARLLAPLLILKFPIPGITLSILADLYDWQFYPVSNAVGLGQYQAWDKALDLYYHLFILYIVFKFKDKIARKAAIFLFAYRIVGLALFTVTHNRQFFFFFPNFFENFVIFYLFYKLFSKEDILFKSKKTFFAILSVIAIPKIIHEYFQHFLVKQPWEIYDVGAYLQADGILREYINYLSWGALFYIVPMGVLLYFLTRKNK